MDNIGENIRINRKKIGLSQGELAQMVEITAQAVSQYERNITKPKYEVLLKLNQILKVNLIDGNKTVAENQSNPYNIDPKELNNPSISEAKGAPYYDIDFKGGFDMVFNDQSIRPSFYIDFPPFNDADGWINATGKSMGPLIAHGDIVALKRVPDWRDFLLEGEIYALVTKNGFRTIKILGKGPDKSHYMLIPYNKGEEYNPQPIPKTMITHVFRVMGAMKKFF